jgi:hypothetical protein
MACGRLNRLKNETPIMEARGMRYDKLMWFGAFIAVPTVFIAPFVDAGMLSVVTLGGGILFGKGYGIWEERTRK